LQVEREEKLFEASNSPEKDRSRGLFAPEIKKLTAWVNIFAGYPLVA
jgi:hypothetical protein